MNRDPSRSKMRQFALISFFIILLGQMDAFAVAQVPASASSDNFHVVYQFVPPQTILPSPVQDDKFFWLGLSGTFSQFIQPIPGVSFSAGYQPSSLGFDLKLTYLKASYGNLSVPPDPSLTNGYNWVGGTEVDRPRQPSDNWTVITIEPGINIAGCLLFTRLLPLLTEKARFGIAYASMTDNANHIAFTGALFSFEAALQYQFSHESPYSIELGIAYREGIIQSNRIPGLAGALPLAFVTNTLSLLIWL